MQTLIKYMPTLLKYMKQPSTWQGFVGVATAFGIVLTPEQFAAIIAAGIGLVGLIDVFWDTDA